MTTIGNNAICIYRKNYFVHSTFIVLRSPFNVRFIQSTFKIVRMYIKKLTGFQHIRIFCRKTTRTKKAAELCSIFLNWLSCVCGFWRCIGWYAIISIAWAIISYEKISSNWKIHSQQIALYLFLSFRWIFGALHFLKAFRTAFLGCNIYTDNFPVFHV